MIVDSSMTAVNGEELPHCEVHDQQKKYQCDTCGKVADEMVLHGLQVRFQTISNRSEWICSIGTPRFRRLGSIASIIGPGPHR